MIAIIDNYDSFTYNLVQLVYESAPDCEIQVFRNDAVSIDELRAMQPQALILSPGPGHPKDAGITLEAIDAFKGKIPILGVCLGHQAIALAFGGTIVHARELVHGKAMPITIEDHEGILKSLQDFQGARYHSLAVADLPDCLKITARCGDEIMAIEHKDYPIYGLQFHPESILTPDGKKIMNNFLKGISSC